MKKLNIALAAVCVGVALLCWSLMSGSEKTTRQKEAQSRIIAEAKPRAVGTDPANSKGRLQTNDEVTRQGPRFLI